MDRVAFAKLISVFTLIAGRELSTDQISEISNTLQNIGTPRVEAASINALLLRIWRREKIEAIREYRALTGQPLKDSKDAIEAYWLDHNPQAAE